MRRMVRRGILLGLVTAVLVALWRAAQRRQDERALEWEASPFPYPPVPKAATTEPAPSTVEAPWVEPIDGTCPATHPVKGKLKSGIYHEPGRGSYDRTKADRCYLDAAAAEADGLRAPKS